MRGRIIYADTCGHRPDIHAQELDTLIFIVSFHQEKTGLASTVSIRCNVR
jgi:hypothetical protein